MDRKARIREKVHKSFESLESDIRVDDPSAQLVYDNQKEAGFEIFENFYEGVMACTLLALPQVGKTGVMLWISYLMTTTLVDELCINPNNIYIISGMNDIDWKTQTKSNFPGALNEHVYTRSEFNKISTLSSLQNALIIIDECHIAAEERQQLSKKLRLAGLNNPESLREKNVRILQVSATPAHTLFNADRIWGDDHAIVRLIPSSRYIGFEQLLAADRIMDTTDMSSVQLFTEIKNQIKLIYKTPKYHIIRLGRGNSKPFYEMVSSNSWVVKTHNSESREDTDLLFETPPVQHTFLVIKGFWRAGKRLNDQNIGIMYEGPSNIPDANVVAQSLAGRACGNDKQIPGDKSPMIYCHRKSIVDYVNWAKGDGTFENKNYQSRHLRVDEHGNVNVRSTFHGGTFVRRISDYDISELTFDTVDDAKKWCENNLMYKCSPYGLYGAGGKNGIDGKPKEGNTHIMYRGIPRQIMTESDARGNLISDGVNNGARIMPVSHDLGWGVKDCARIMPVDVGQGANTAARIMPVTTPNLNLRYIVIYKKDKLKST
jgi:hypothetical protein